ncbi:sulfur carrier protein ThiS [Methanobrevibacter filiformis]|uniref:Sulfur carrier protein ThiS n=1 Tax=Methanobrevibacter filiformis TaxID=55758 RepID=A0A166ERE5_9EURY|nr:sulfur carrier protein ThiS [Methanobrevibacter filiformis]KZX16929.1 sulfur carrier protein ThiS [Methanobrevibacter filiformis]
MKVNGKETTFKEGITLSEFLEKSDYSLEKIVVERNGKIISKNSYCEIILKNEDNYEIVSFVGGG